MPTYDYKCKQCGDHFEIVCHFDERDEKSVCPACGSRDVETVLSGRFSSPGVRKFNY